MPVSSHTLRNQNKPCSAKPKNRADFLNVNVKQRQSVGSAPQGTPDMAGRQRTIKAMTRVQGCIMLQQLAGWDQTAARIDSCLQSPRCIRVRTVTRRDRGSARRLSRYPCGDRKTLELRSVRCRDRSRRCWRAWTDARAIRHSWSKQQRQHHGTTGKAAALARR